MKRRSPRSQGGPGASSRIARSRQHGLHFRVDYREHPALPVIFYGARDHSGRRRRDAARRLRIPDQAVRQPGAPAEGRRGASRCRRFSARERGHDGRVARGHHHAQPPHGGLAAPGAARRRFGCERSHLRRFRRRSSPARSTGLVPADEPFVAVNCGRSGARRIRMCGHARGASPVLSMSQGGFQAATRDHILDYIVDMPPPLQVSSAAGCRKAKWRPVVSSSRSPSTFGSSRRRTATLTRRRHPGPFGKIYYGSTCFAQFAGACRPPRRHPVLRPFLRRPAQRSNGGARAPDARRCLSRPVARHVRHLLNLSTAVSSRPDPLPDSLSWRCGRTRVACCRSISAQDIRTRLSRSPAQDHSACLPRRGLLPTQPHGSTSSERHRRARRCQGSSSRRFAGGFFRRVSRRNFPGRRRFPRPPRFRCHVATNRRVSLHRLSPRGARVVHWNKVVATIATTLSVKFDK